VSRATASRARTSWGRALRVLLVVAVFCAGFAYGFVADRRRLFPYDLIRGLYFTGVESGVVERQTGRWRQARPGLGAPGMTDAEREELSKLSALGYLRGVKPAEERSGITVYDPDLAYDGLNLVVSAHAHEAWLMDMDGEMLHSWARDFWTVWPDWKEARGWEDAEHWGYVHLFEDGGLLAVYNNFGVVRLDKDSNILWSYDGRSHHDLYVAGDGTIYAVDLEIREVPGFAEGNDVWDNFITVLSPEGEVEKRVSIIEAFLRSRYAPVLDAAGGFYDVLHTNTVEVLDGRHEHILPAFRKGNVLVSPRTLDAIAVVDLDAEAVVWAMTGMWRAQHDPTFLDSGRILLFDNLAGDEVSEVIEFDPLTQEVFWSYKGSPATPFFSRSQGRNQRLPNGNTLITESDNGRIFEVTPDKSIVWEFVNPKRAGEENELIASIPMAVRLPRDFPLEWLEKGD